MPVSRETFLQQCKRRFGTANPERMQLAHWEWMVRRGCSAYAGREAAGVESDVDCQFDGTDIPDWCFDRVGRSRTLLPDGRQICIGGEHEDFYDPDFCIYNDVAVLRPAAGATDVTEDAGDVEIYGYPEQIFPPTDFHSATLVGERIYIIGALGYQSARRAGETPLFALDTRDYRITPVETRGTPPGWIFKHYGSYDPIAHAITVRGGQRHPDAYDQDHPAPTAHRLHLTDLRWEALPPNGPDQYYLLRNYDRMKSYALAELPLRPSLPHEWLGDDGRCGDLRIGVQGYRVTLSSEVGGIQVRIEGGLARDVVDALLHDLSSQLMADTGDRWGIEKGAKRA